MQNSNRVAYLSYPMLFIVVYLAVLFTPKIEQKGMTFDHHFSNSFSFSYSLFFRREENSGKKNNQSRGQRSNLSARSTSNLLHKGDGNVYIRKRVYNSLLYWYRYIINPTLSEIASGIKKNKESVKLWWSLLRDGRIPHRIP